MNNTTTRIGMNFELERAMKANPELGARAETMVELYKDKLQPWSFFVVDNHIIYIGVTSEGKLRAEVVCPMKFTLAISIEEIVTRLWKPKLNPKHSMVSSVV